jgi:glycosyltransferase involved in cell wall biosynthesis
MTVPYIKFLIRDLLQINLIGAVGLFFYILAVFFKLIKSKNYWLKFNLMSIRYSYLPAAQRSLKDKVDAGAVQFKNYISQSAQISDALQRAIVLSPPVFEKGLLRKGVILITFTHTFSFFLRHSQWSNLNKYYAFVLEPSWAGYADPDVLAFLQSADHCIVQASEIKDRAFINSVFPQVTCLDTGASNWVDYDKFNADVIEEKIYDSVYVANMNPIKRVYAAIDAVVLAKKLKPNYKMRIICASVGSGSISEFHDYIKRRSLQENVFLSDGMPQARLIQEVKKAKCSILLSLKEGSNRTLFESMFLNVPVICLCENIGVNKSYINHKTGLLISRNMVSDSLIFMASQFTRYEPRRWALSNISPNVTTTALKDTIHSRFGEDVNSDIYVKVNSPEVGYKNYDIKDLRIDRLFGDFEADEFERRSLSFFDAVLTSPESRKQL